MSRRQLREGASDGELYAITIDIGQCMFDVDARASDIPAALASGLRGIAERNLAVASAVDAADRAQAILRQAAPTQAEW